MSESKTTCARCERGQEACVYCHDLGHDISEDVICDCGLDDFGVHLLDCLERSGHRWVVADTQEQADELL